MMGRMAGEWNIIQSIQTVTCRTGAEGSLFRLALKAQCRGRLEWQWGGDFQTMRQTIPQSQFQSPKREHLIGSGKMRLPLLIQSTEVWKAGLSSTNMAATEEP